MDDPAAPAHHPLVLHLQSVLGPLPASALALALQARERRVPHAGVLLAAGQRWQQLWWVAEGGLRLYYLDRQGRSANKNFFLPGSVVWPITPALADEPVDFWIEALRETCVWGMPSADWQAACAGWPAWQALERQTLVRLLEDKMHREQRLLQDTATARYQALQAEQPAWVQCVPLKHLASYLGITDVALSRIRRRLNPG